MTDSIFGQLDYEEGIGWNGKTTVLFGGRQYETHILIQVDEDEGTDVTDVTDVTDAQRNAFLRFTEKWDSIEPVLVEALIQYYNNEEKYSYGPDDEEEAALWWQDIDTYEQLVNAVTPETLVIPPDYLMDEGRRVYLLLDRTWGGGDPDDNGVGVCFIDEQIHEIGYKDIAF